MSKNPIKHFEHLPEDNFCVHVENEKDKICLLYLVNKVGEEKIRRSAKKYKYYPESLVYVSTLLKWYKVKVPVEVYAPRFVPIYRVYLLVIKDLSCIKIGFSGNWIQRVLSFSRDEGLDSIFDLDMSVSTMFKNKVEAMAVERGLKNRLVGFQLPISALKGRIHFNAGGVNEWYSFDGYMIAKDTLSQHGKLSSLLDVCNWPDVYETCGDA